MQRSTEGAIAHRVRGPCQHLWDEIDKLNPPRVFLIYCITYSLISFLSCIKVRYLIKELCTTLQEERDPESFSTFKERLHYLQVSVSIFFKSPSYFLCQYDIMIPFYSFFSENRAQ